MKVELLNVFGDDEMVANAARVSYAKNADNYTEAQNDKLISFLAREKHIAPFFHPKIQFRIECPIYVERQIFKTAVGVDVNSVSGRYVDFSDSYTLIPDGEWRLQSKDSKQGSAGLANEEAQGICASIQYKIKALCEQGYAKMSELGISKEQARTILPINLNTQYIWTGSLYAFIRLCNLRLKPDAQKETRDLVSMMFQEVKENGSFDKSLEAFGIIIN